MTCTSTKHKEFDCRIQYSLGLKFTYDKWCIVCKETFKSQEKEFSIGRSTRNTKRQSNV